MAMRSQHFCLSYSDPDLLFPYDSTPLSPSDRPSVARPSTSPNDVDRVASDPPGADTTSDRADGPSGRIVSSSSPEPASAATAAATASTITTASTAAAADMLTDDACTDDSGRQGERHSSGRTARVNRIVQDRCRQTHEWIGNCAADFSFNRVTPCAAVSLTAVYFSITYGMFYLCREQWRFFGDENVLTNLPYFFAGVSAASIVECWHYSMERVYLSDQQSEIDASVASVKYESEHGPHSELSESVPLLPPPSLSLSSDRQPNTKENYLSVSSVSTALGSFLMLERYLPRLPYPVSPGFRDCTWCHPFISTIAFFIWCFLPDCLAVTFGILLSLFGDLNSVNVETSDRWIWLPLIFIAFLCVSLLQRGTETHNFSRYEYFKFGHKFCSGLLCYVLFCKNLMEFNLFYSLLTQYNCFPL